jgi:hypothetical protein
MIQRLISATLFLSFFACFGLAQDNPFPKFKVFREAVPGIDFYADQKTEVDPFIKPLADARGKMASFLGDDIAKGAIFICSTLAQKDSIYDQRIFKFYKWYLIQLTAEAQREERLARSQAAAAAAAAQGGQSGQGGRSEQAGQSGRTGRGEQSGQGGRGEQGGRQGGTPGGMQSPEFRAMAEARAAAQLASQMGYAILMSSLDNEKPYRPSRLDDMSRSPFNDWLDIALVAHATGTAQGAFRVLQERVDDCFPLDDVLSMSRPFVAQTTDSGSSGGGGGGGGMGAGPVMLTGAGPGGGTTSGTVAINTGVGGGDRGSAGQAGGRSGSVGQGGGRGGSRVLSKDVVDRMVFDAQATAFFAYLIEKVGIEKVKDLVQQQRKKTESLAVVQTLLGPDADKTEMEFMDWVKTQK